MKSNSLPLNPWALVAVVCSIGMCPFFTIAGVLLGIRAIVDIKARPVTRGIPLAWTAICVGALVTGLWVGGMLWWNFNVRNQMRFGPISAIHQGQAGNILGFESSFVDPPIVDQAKQFLQQLTNRYGALQYGGLSETLKANSVECDELIFFLVPPKAELAYSLQFTGPTHVDATASFVLFRRVDGVYQFTNKFAWICIHDEELGDLVYPMDAAITHSGGKAQE